MRRCTVYYGYWRPDVQVQVHYEGWLVQVLGVGHSEYVVVANEHGQMRQHPLNSVRLHMPVSIPLMDGAPRRGVHGDGLPADEN